jgi:hypothetical protein
MLARIMSILRPRHYTWLLLLVAVLSLGGGVARADEACKLAKPGSPMSKPCAEGGIKKAKEAMKTLVRDARKAGVKMECDECHKDPARYDVLADDARVKLDKLLKAASPPAKVVQQPNAKPDGNAQR